MLVAGGTPQGMRLGIAAGVLSGIPRGGVRVAE